MLTLEFVNYVLSLVGEQPLLTSNGSLGSLVRSCIYSSTLAVVQSSRASFFEQMLTGTATNEDYLVPAMSLPTEVIQVYQTWLLDVNGTLVELGRQPLQNFPYSYPIYTYDIIGNQLYVNPRLVRPVNLRLRALVAPSLPTADDVDCGIPKPAQPAIAHGAASIMCLSYVDDANAASQHKRLADEMTLMLRQQFGVTRARSFNVGG